jgi:hypothetical protein
LVRFCVVLRILVLYTGAISKLDKRRKLFKTAVIVQTCRVSVLPLIIQRLKPGIGQELNIRAIQSKRIPFG